MFGVGHTFPVSLCPQIQPNPPAKTSLPPSRRNIQTSPFCPFKPAPIFAHTFAQTFRPFCCVRFISPTHFAHTILPAFASAQTSTRFLAHTSAYSPVEILSESPCTILAKPPNFVHKSPPIPLQTAPLLHPYLLVLSHTFCQNPLSSISCKKIL